MEDWGGGDKRMGNNWLYWGRLSVMEDGIEEFVDELGLRFGLFDDNTQIRLQGYNLVVELAISSNLGKEHSGKSVMIVSGFSPEFTLSS